MIELAVGPFLVGLALGVGLTAFAAHGLLAAEYAKLREELAQVKALRIRLRGRG